MALRGNFADGRTAPGQLVYSPVASQASLSLLKSRQFWAIELSPRRADDPLEHLPRVRTQRVHCSDCHDFVHRRLGPTKTVRPSVS